jgi:hypothetical protein
MAAPYSKLCHLKNEICTSVALYGKSNEGDKGTEVI